MVSLTSARSSGRESPRQAIRDSFESMVRIIVLSAVVKCRLSECRLSVFSRARCLNNKTYDFEYIYEYNCSLDSTAKFLTACRFGTLLNSIDESIMDFDYIWPGMASWWLQGFKIMMQVSCVFPTLVSML